MPEPGYEWYGAKLAERALRPGVADVDLFDFCLFLRDKILDDQRYEPLARRAEVLLISRMSGNGRAPDEVRGSTGLELCHHRRAMDALCSAKLTHMALIDLAELAHSEHHDDKAGLWVQDHYTFPRRPTVCRMLSVHFSGFTLA